jgi:hypothetical protein
MRGFFIFLFLIFGCGLSFCQDPSCAITWDTIKQMSFDPASSVLPEVVAIGDTVHVVWFVPGTLYRLSWDGGKTFSSTRQILSPDSGAGATAKFAAANNHAYVVFDCSYPCSTMVLRRSTDAGLTWGPLVPLLGSISAIAAIDSSVYIYFDYMVGDTVYGGVLRSHDYGVDWDTVYGHRSIPNSQLEALPGYLFATYPQRIKGAHTEVLFKRSMDEGDTFSVPDTLSTNDSLLSAECDMAADQHGNIVVAWCDAKYGSIDSWHGSIMYRTSSDFGETWQAEKLLTYAPTGVLPKVSIKDSIVAITWNDYIGEFQNRSMMRVSRDLGATWCDTFALNGSGGDVNVSVKTGLVYTVWGNNQEIFYDRGMIDGYHDGGISIPLAVNSQWNLISLPVRVSDSSKTTLFPEAISDAFAFSGNAYAAAESLKVGTGYWVKFPNEGTEIISGNPIPEHTIDLVEGWNLVGSISYRVEMTQISTVPAKLLSSPFYSYSNGYVAVSALEPGKAYWIKASSGGRLIIQGFLPNSARNRSAR